MKREVLLLVACLCLPSALSALIIDHTCTDLLQVPDQYLQKARKELKVSFAHGAAAAQITLGLQGLKQVNPVLYNFNTGREEELQDSLSIWDHTPSGELGLEERKNGWSSRTEKFLMGLGKDRNVVIWAWNREIGNIQRNEVQRYLKQMEELENRFPNVKFIYMTGPLDGSGENSEVHRRYEMIRKFCRENGKILFDFADIESFSPTGKTNYLKLNGNSDCTYTAKGKTRNWAAEWLQRHPEIQSELPEKVGTTHPLNAALKARAFWWMMARLSGWVPSDKVESGILRPLPKAAAAVDVAKDNKEKTDANKRVYRFDKAQDYRFWVLDGAQGTLIPEQGSGMLIPPGKPAIGMHRGLMCVQELEFKARLEKGTTINWYINTDWNKSWKPQIGLGGVFSDQGCLLLVNGESIRFNNPIPIDREEHRFQVWVKANHVYWSIDGKSIAVQPIPYQLAERQGTLALGGWDSSVRFSAVFFQAK